MGVGWDYCPICEKVFRGTYFPDTGVNTATHAVERHMILRHGKKITPNGIEDAKIPDDFIRVIRSREFAGRGSADIICVCGRYFTVDVYDFYYNGKNVRVIVREYDDITRYKKISEWTETIYVGYVDVHKFEKMLERTWERVKKRIIREHLMEHGIHI